MARSCALVALIVAASFMSCVLGDAGGETAAACPAGGCDLTVVAPVCGTDGITYQSSCLALCQGVAITKNAPCKARDANLFTPMSLNDVTVAGAENANVDRATMERFKTDGYVFAGKGKSDPNFVPKRLTVRPGSTSSSSTLPPKSTSVRYMAESGFIYTSSSPSLSPLSNLLKSLGANANAVASSVAFDPSARPRMAPRNASRLGVLDVVAGADVADPGAIKADMADVAAGVSVSTGFAQDDASTGNDGTLTDSIGSLGRKLLETVASQTIFGSDDRVRISPTTSFPWTTVGLVQFTINGGSFGCSGIMISPTSFLTAAHCVHGGRGGAWASSIRFSPGADASARPYGTVDFAWVTTYQEWINNGCSSSCTVDQFFYDLAVVRLSTAVGLSAGWMGLAGGSTFNIQATTAGYPGDKPSSTMWRATCPVTDTNANSLVSTTTNCDTKGGQSGSGLWETSSNTIRAVCSFESSLYNGFVKITPARFWDLMSWAGGSFTAWNDAGERDGYKSIYLDRHDLSFCNSLQAMSSFKLELAYNNPAVMRVTYQCDAARSRTGAAAVRYTTAANDWGGGNTVFFDRHAIACPANQLLQRWRLIRPSSNQIAFEYWCLPATVNTASCQNLATPWNSNGGGQVNFLDRHAVACPSGRLLTRWVLETNNAAGQYRIAFTCCA